MLNDEYGRMPQNDLVQIEGTEKDYKDLGKGLAHGFQKDAIQNGVGARVNKSMKKACLNGWAFNFELIEINGKKSITFWDEGTTGLIGRILSLEEIEIASAAGELGSSNSDEKLSRFFSRFESGGNLGAGMFGRGKLIFSAASKDKSLLVDSLRTDKKYVASDRKIYGTTLSQLKKPKEDEDAKSFILEQSLEALEPLTSPGTRITVLNIKEDLLKAFELSFEDSNNEESLYHMISETWWEIIKLGAKINLIRDGQILPVGLTSDLEPLLNAKHGIDGYKVYKKELKPINVDDQEYKIKEIKLVVAKDKIPKNLRGVWGQRKTMQVGDMFSDIRHEIKDKTFGYLRFDDDLETKLEEAENRVHYGFSGKTSIVKRIRQFIRNSVDEFASDLGFVAESSERRTRNIVNSALNELNDLAKGLGLQTGFGGGTQIKNYSLSIESFLLPNQDTKRVEIGQQIGPIEYCFRNHSTNLVRGNFVITFEQGNIKEEVWKGESISINSRDSKNIKIDKLKIEEGVFSNEALLIVKARFIDSDTSQDFASLTREIWLGIDPPPPGKNLVELTVLPMQYPRKDTKRVELGESLGNIGFSVKNKENTDFKLKCEVVVRRSKTEDRDVEVLHSLVKQEFVLKALSDYQWETHDLEISEEMFGVVFNDENTTDKYKKCEFFYRFSNAERYDEYDLIKGTVLAKNNSRDFYCGVNPAGQSLFKKCQSVDDKDDPHRAKTSGSVDDGYIFILNTGHPAYKYIEEISEELCEAYCQEQMMYHSVLNAIHDDKFVGVLEDHQDLSGHDLDSHAVASKVDLIMGKLLQKLRS